MRAVAKNSDSGVTKALANTQAFMSEVYDDIARAGLIAYNAESVPARRKAALLQTGVEAGSTAIPALKTTKLAKIKNADKIEGVPDRATGDIKFKRWSNGDAIDKPMPDGSAPSWNTVRSRYWKNRASASQGEFDAENIKRMQTGKAPQLYNSRTGNFESVELHHVVPQRAGGSNGPINLREVTPDQHGAIDPFRHTVPTTTGAQSVPLIQ